MPIIDVNTGTTSMTSAQLAAALTGLKTQIDTATAAMLAKIAASGNTTPAVDTALTALTASVQALTTAAQ